MIMFAAAVLLMLIALLAITLEKTYFYLPYKELKRQAAARNPLARTFFHVAAYGGELKLLLWAVIGLSAAGGFVLFARVAPPIFGFVVVALTLWLAFVWLPRTRLNRVGAQLAVWCTPLVVRCLRILHPAMEYVAMYVGRLPVGPHTGLYEREDLYDLLEQQKRQSDNRISDYDLALIRKALRFRDKRVADAMIPRRKVKALEINEHLGPVLINELHESGHAFFPVYQGKTSNVVGILPLQTVADVKEHGSVGDHASQHVAYIHEVDSLAQAVRTFYDTDQHLLIVLNSTENYTGILTLRDVLKELMDEAEIGSQIHDERKMVAGRHYQKEPTIAELEEKLRENPPEVIE